MKELYEEEFIDWWLEKYHDTNLDKIAELHPEWILEPQKHNMTFYNTYACSQEQHDEWYQWAIGRIMQHRRCGKKRAIRGFAFDYLNVSPTIRE